jgi:pyrroloquinoline quinone biosynthesis protein B
MIKKALQLVAILFISYSSFAQNPYVLVLGIPQDGGYPQANCQKSCCKSVWEQKVPRQFVSSIALVDPVSNEKWIFDCTPDFKDQLFFLQKYTQNQSPLAGIFLTHAHIGHYTGLMQLGREVMNTNKVKVYAMPKMKSFLETNGPWSQLVNLQNIDIQPINEETDIVLNERLKIRAFRVPHRDEFSETVGFKIISKNKSLIFIPDIDKWQKWGQNLSDLTKANDYLLLDGTFYKDGEIARPMAEVPHPFVSETIDILDSLPYKTKAKVHFIHLNHTNPIISKNSAERKALLHKGFKVADLGLKLGL